MKKAMYTIFCFMVVLCIFPLTAFADDFSKKAISVLQEYSRLDNELRAAFLAGDRETQREKGKLLIGQQDDLNKILKALPGEYCADPQMDLLREFIKVLINTTDEYPTYVFAELYACDPETVTKEILALKLEDQKKIVDDLSWGFKNVKYKIESLPDYKELKENLKNLKSSIRSKK